jgi:uncharacterized protein YdeI (YjbR/CyaY-like superfamily)
MDRQPYDNHYVLMRFTSRRMCCKWSEINRERELIVQGKMKPAGLAAVHAAKTDSSWDAAYPLQSACPVPDDLRRALNENPWAKAFFATLTGQRVTSSSILCTTSPTLRSARTGSPST